MARKGRGIFMVYVDIDPQHVQEFNKWYNEEHLPELLSVPGILSAARYEAVKGGPQYLACYELESVAVMQTPAFTNLPVRPCPKARSGRSNSNIPRPIRRACGTP